MRRSNCAGAMEYVPELTWILFLHILDEHETRESQISAARGLPFTPSIVAPYRWQDWAAPNGAKRKKLQDEVNTIGVFTFLHEKLLPYLRALGATARQKVIAQVFSNIERTRIDTEYNFWEIIDRVHEIHDAHIDDTHIFPLSQVYEGLLLHMGEKRNDGGQFFTPREVIRAMVRVVDPQIGQTIYDPCCGTGGFLAQAYEYLYRDNLRNTEIEALKLQTLYGREKDNTIYPIALANLVLHGIDKPNLWHGNALTGQEIYGDLFEGAPPLFDIILTNPPFGGKEGKEAQAPFVYKTNSTQVLFLQHVMDSLAPGGRCGIVVDEGVLFRTNPSAFVKTKQKLLNECDVYCIVSLPGGVFTQAGAGVKTNLIFFTKGRPTENIWYYDLTHLNIRKRDPLTHKHFEHFFEMLPNRADSKYSWTVNIPKHRAQAQREATTVRKEARAKRREITVLQTQLDRLKSEGKAHTDAYQNLQIQIREIKKELRDIARRIRAIEEAVYNLKAINPHTRSEADTRSPKELIKIIEMKGEEIAKALSVLQEN
ncbi:MAG: N-6 DNA methylase [Anaerolineae bacterium]|nr:N-6 DNA methylase [Anaerolineae bacterium]